jgi:thioredoxin reductase (NADPH)
MIELSALSAVPMFSKAAPEALARMVGSAADLHLAVGEYAAHEGDPRALFVVLAGKIEVTKSIDGIVRTIGWRAPGQSEATVKAGRWGEDRDPYLLETSVPGIFACGDVRSSPVKRVAAAVGEGSMAIAFVHQYLQRTARAT